MTNGSNSATVLRGFVERIERLEAEKAALNEDIREIYKEVKETEFIPKILRKIIAARKKDTEKYNEEQDLITSYFTIIGIW